MKISNTLKAICVGGMIFIASLQTKPLNAEWDIAYWSDSYIDYQSAYEDYLANSHYDWAYNYYYLGEAVPYYHYYVAGWNIDHHTRNGTRGYIAYNQWALDTYNYYADIGDYYFLTYF